MVVCAALCEHDVTSHYSSYIALSTYQVWSELEKSSNELRNTVHLAHITNFEYCISKGLSKAIDSDNHTCFLDMKKNTW